MKKEVFLISIILLSTFSCKTIDIEKKESKKIKKQKTELDEQLEEAKKLMEYQVKEEEFTYDVEPVVIPTTTYVLIDKNDVMSKPKEEEVKVGRDAVKQSMKDSIIPLKEYVGGTSIFDYNENSQFPVFTKMLAMTTIILNNDEEMIDTEPFMSDTNSWDVTGDVWTTDEGERQLIMIKPKESGLETNMLIVTNKRLYHFVLYSTKSDYQPIVRFRYPSEKKFITSQTKKQKPNTVDSEYGVSNPELLSFNYKVSVPALQKKVDWVPELVYDDGSHTYIVLPEIVLQKEYPAIWEGRNEITNYEIHPLKHNMIIINKLVEKVTLKVGRQKVIIKKKRGEPIDITALKR